MVTKLRYGMSEASPNNQFKRDKPLLGSPQQGHYLHSEL